MATRPRPPLPGALRRWTRLLRCSRRGCLAVGGRQHATGRASRRVYFAQACAGCVRGLPRGRRRHRSATRKCTRAAKRLDGIIVAADAAASELATTDIGAGSDGGGGGGGGGKSRKKGGKKKSRRRMTIGVGGRAGRWRAAAAAAAAAAAGCHGAPPRRASMPSQGRSSSGMRPQAALRRFAALMTSSVRTGITRRTAPSIQTHTGIDCGAQVALDEWRGEVLAEGPLRRGLDLGCGSGEATAAFEAWDGASGCDVTAADPYTYGRLSAHGRPAERWTCGRGRRRARRASTLTFASRARPSFDRAIVPLHTLAALAARRASSSCSRRTSGLSSTRRQGGAPLASSCTSAFGCGSRGGRRRRPVLEDAPDETEVD